MQIYLIAPAPAPSPQARQFTVYFEFDKSALTPEGSKVVSDAAAYYKQTGSVRVAVTGYTDRHPGRVIKCLGRVDPRLRALHQEYLAKRARS
jgi:hypothetical protein